VESDALRSRRPGELVALLALFHPLPVLITVAAAAGFALAAAHGDLPADRLGWFLGSVLLTQLAISVHNDYCDRGLDAVAKPDRALPRGSLAPTTALGLATLLLAAGLALSWPLGPAALALGALGTGAGLLYSAGLKRTIWSWAPFWVGFPTLALWAFAAAERLRPDLWSVYLVGLPLVLAIHLADTLPDVASDRAAGVRGLAHRLGPTATQRASWLALLVGLVLAQLARPGGPALSAAWLASLVGLVAAMILRRDLARGHWLAVAAGALALGLDWLLAIS
jgi:4-hydroxybenzoate polyprenyltransferase